MTTRRGRTTPQAADQPDHGWRKGPPSHVIADLKRRAAGAREGRLFCVACCRHLAADITHPDCLALLDLAEAYADDLAVGPAMMKVRRRVVRWANAIRRSALSNKDWNARWSAYGAADPKLTVPVTGFVRPPAFRDLLAEVDGPRVSAVAFDPAWRTSTTVALARQMYDARDVGPMPILADALQDAGCGNEVIRSHCRSEGLHVRGCWVVDQVSEKG
ncbi:MAG: hypothetical protein JWO38_683 [Gemmataceae bacterium]|nr:hypothetical protein [Gemmataceae bacterium]